MRINLRGVQNASSAAPVVRPTILVVDDDTAVRLSLQVVIEALGYLVVTAGDGVRGLAAFRESPPALVLTDIIMPEKDGIELIREMRRERPEAKIIAMSGGARRQHRLCCPGAEARRRRRNREAL